MVKAHMPPTTPREALHALFGEAHADHTVLAVEFRNTAVIMQCSCKGERWPIDEARAGESGLTLKQLRHALRNAPRKPELERKAA